ncbi:hypothetical protein [Acetobacterium sp.]|uniref:hypothetical protein n=1 Tax=Acetobacterium sp. TaxID=1872094 RepID=UPI002F3E37AC
MDKVTRALILTVVAFFLFAGVAFGIETISLNQLIETAKVMDGKTVVVQGEAISEALERGNNAWVNINDGTNAIGIWLNREDANKIKVFGDYLNIGDKVKVTGVFNRACVEHGGDMDIHATSIEVVENGYPVKEKVPSQKIAIGIIFVVVTLMVTGFYFKIMKKPTS